MTTIYPTPTAVPSEGRELISDPDATQQSFDVYEAYQRSLADEEVSPIVDNCHILIQPSESRYPPL